MIAGMSLTELVARIDVDRLTTLTLRRIRRELPNYQVVDEVEHADAIRAQIANQVHALSVGGPVASSALEEASRLARNRARQGVKVESLLGAYLRGSEMIWHAVADTAEPSESSQLADAASLLLAYQQSLSTVLAAAHDEASKVMESRRITASQRFVELLSSGDQDGESRAHAEVIGLDPEGEFVAIVWGSQGKPAALPTTALDALERNRVSFVAGLLATDSVLICQGAEPSMLVDLIGPLLSDGQGGVGLLRSGLSGAAESLLDARIASATKTPVGSLSMLVDVWPDACVHQEASRLDAILAPVRSVAAHHPHLAEAVLAFADKGMQMAPAAVTLNLHANSLSYRLARWHLLTDWNPRTFEGLRRSVIAIRSVL